MERKDNELISKFKDLAGFWKIDEHLNILNANIKEKCIHLNWI